MKGTGNVLFFAGLVIFAVIIVLSFAGINLQDWNWFSNNPWFITAICVIAMIAMIAGRFFYAKLKRRK